MELPFPAEDTFTLTYFSGSDRPAGSTPLSSAGLEHPHQHCNIRKGDLQVLVSNDQHHDADDKVDDEVDPENELLTTSSRSSILYPVIELLWFSELISTMFVSVFLTGKWWF